MKSNTTRRPRRCVICGAAIKTEYGHNAQPIAAGMCCDVCNYSVVVPARIAAALNQGGNQKQ